MATFTTLLQLTKPDVGEAPGLWGPIVNNEITTLIEEAISSRELLNMWESNTITLTTADRESSSFRRAILDFNDPTPLLTGPAEVICQSLTKIYIVSNSTVQPITFRTAPGTGSTTILPAGNTTILFCDGANINSAISHIPSLQLGASSPTTVDTILDEDDMVSDSATALATQQSIKAYVENTHSTLAQVLNVGDVTGDNQNIVMSTGSTIDAVDGTAVTIAQDTNFRLGTTAANANPVNAIRDEDDLISDSATSLATQQSIKAYVDNVETSTLTEILEAGNTTGAYAIELSAGSSLQSVGDVNLIPAASSNTTISGDAGHKLKLQAGPAGSTINTVNDTTATASPLYLQTSNVTAATINANQDVLIGHETPIAVSGIDTANLQVVGAGTTNDSSINVSNFSAGTQGPNLNFGKARSDTIGTMTAVTDGDSLGTLNFAGADGSDIASVGARIATTVDGTVTGNSVPGAIAFETTVAGGTTPVERLQITNEGVVLSTGSTLQSVDSNVIVAQDTSLQLGTTLANPVSAIRDEDNMASDSATSLATQQSIKAYVDDTHSTLAQVLGKGDVTGTNQNIVLSTGSEIQSAGDINLVPATSSSVVIAGDAGNSLEAQASSTGSTITALNTTATSANLQLKTGTAAGVTIDNLQRVLVGSTTASSVVSNPTAKLQVASQSSTTAAINLSNFQANTSLGPSFNFGKSRGAYGVPSIIRNNDELGTINFTGADGVDLQSTGARIISRVDGTPAVNSMPGDLTFQTCSQGDTTPTTRMEIRSSGLRVFDNGYRSTLSFTRSLPSGTTATQRLFNVANLDADVYGTVVWTAIVDLQVLYNNNGNNRATRHSRLFYMDARYNLGGSEIIVGETKDVDNQYTYGSRYDTTADVATHTPSFAQLPTTGPIAGLDVDFSDVTRGSNATLYATIHFSGPPAPTVVVGTNEDL